MGVSDDSYFSTQEVGGCRWNISILDSSEWIEGGGIIPGLIMYHNIYMSKLGGHLCIASFMSSTNLPKGKYTLKTVCGGVLASKRLGLDYSHTRCSSKHMDMVSIITELWDESDFNYTRTCFHTSR